MIAPSLHLSGPTMLERAVRRAATRAGYRLISHEHPTQGRSVLSAGSIRTELPADAQVPWTIVDRAVDALLSACVPLPRRTEVVALAPAAGVCGPAGAGPVDAIRIGELRERRYRGQHVHTRLLSAQHTRCWVLNCTCLPDGAGPLRFAPSASMAVLARTIPTDTAAITQYLQDCGLDDQWPGLRLGGPVQPASDGALRFTVLCTEADWAAELVDRLGRAVAESVP